jgi:hypothetical protein
MLEDEFDQILLANLARILDLDPKLTKKDALGRLQKIAEKAGLVSLMPRLDSLMVKLIRQGVLNPSWLEREGLRAHFILASGRPGLFEQLISLAEKHRAGVSQYIVYGYWDALVILYGTDTEAAQLYASLRTGAYEEPVQFAAEQVLVAYRHRVSKVNAQGAHVGSDIVNPVVLDFDSGANVKARSRLVESGHILGSTWSFEGQPPYPVVAFIGVLLHGRFSAQPSEVVERLLQQEILKDSLVHLFQISQGRPFHYLIKLCCCNMRELDEATNAIGLTSLHNMRFEGTTLMVATGIDQIPMFRQADVTGLTLGPDLTYIIRAGERVFARLPPDQQIAFNRLNEERQVSVVKCLAQMDRSLDESELDPKTKERLESAISTFTRECTSGIGRPNLTGAAIEVTATIEGLLKRLLSRLAYGAYGKNPGKIQKELKLSTSAIRNLSLGKAVEAIRVARNHPDFQFFAQHLEESSLDRVDRFVSARNAWAHDAVDLDGVSLIDEANRTIIEAIELAQWIYQLSEAVEKSRSLVEGSTSTIVPLQLPQAGTERGFGVFISHARADKLIAERIATGLKVFGYRTWYADWELQPGDSIVPRIEAALARNDTLLLLLSQTSVASKWVRRELDTVLMAQLSGQDVAVIPVMIEDCEVPESLKGILSADLRSNFEGGLLQILESLRRRRDLSEEK